MVEGTERRNLSAAADLENGAPTAATPLLPPTAEGSNTSHASDDRNAGGSDSFSGALANVCMSMLGAGQLTLPYAMTRTGLAAGCITLGVLGMLGAYTLHALDRVAAYSGGRTYGEVMRRCLGPRAAQVADAMLAVYAFGGAVAFMMIASEELRLLGNALLPPGHPLWEADRRLLLGALSLALVFPLSCFRSLGFLKPVSTLGSVSAIFITAVVVARAPWRHGALPACGGERGALALWPRSAGEYIGAVPLFAFALNSAWSFVPIRTGLAKPTRARVVSLIALSKALVLANYFTIMVVGYLALCGGEIADNVLDSLGNGALVLLARSALSLQLALALPMRFLVARSVLLRGGLEGRPLAYYGTTLGLVGASTLIACLTSSLHLVIGVTSAVCASALIYILPGAAHYATCCDQRAPPLSPGRLARALLLPAAAIALGSVLLTAGTVFNVLEGAGGG